MSGNKRGTYFEKRVASLLPDGEKVSSRGLPGHDVESAPMRLKQAITKWECKYREELPQWLKDWQDQSVEQDSPVVFAETRGPLWVMLPLDAFELELVDDRFATDLLQRAAEELSDLRGQLLSLQQRLASHANAS